MRDKEREMHFRSDVPFGSVNSYTQIGRCEESKETVNDVYPRHGDKTHTEVFDAFM